jgi:hypothetical protein
MSDIESDTEDRSLSTIQISNAGSPSSSSFEKEEYRAQQLEKLLKRSIDSKQYVILKNISSLIKSDVWKKFGFPAKSRAGGGHEAITSFVACFDCFKTLSFDGSTKYMIKHTCLDTSTVRVETISQQGTINKYLSKKPVIQKQDKETMKEKFVLWTCSSIRPFTIVEDPGFLDVLNEAIRIGK